MSLPAIDWDVALEQVGGEEDFLKELLQDIFKEAQEAQEEMDTLIKSDDELGKRLDKIGKAAHKIKGSASYLGCKALQEISKELQDAGHDGAKDPTEDQLKKCTDLFATYEARLKDLEDVLTEKGYI